MSAQISPSSLLTAAELATAETYLTTTRDALLATVNNLSDAQWHFKPSAGGWSIAEVVEHLALIEDRVEGRLGQMEEAPLADPDRVNPEIEAIILTQVPTRFGRYQAPPPVQPSGRWTPAETVERFVQKRGQTVTLLHESSSLRGHVAPHPVFGNWDGYQWILAVAAHTARHTQQILEATSSPGFPHSN